MRVRLDERTEKLTEVIIGSAFEVSNVLGHGFLEVVYRKALIHEMRQRAFSVSEEVPFPITYKDLEVGTYFADVVVEELVVVELKAVEALASAHVSQVLNYLKASGLQVGLLFNFAKPKLEFRRVLL